jgi:hypothetical protein
VRVRILFSLKFILGSLTFPAEINLNVVGYPKYGVCVLCSSENLKIYNKI